MHHTPLEVEHLMCINVRFDFNIKGDMVDADAAYIRGMHVIVPAIQTIAG